MEKTQTKWIISRYNHDLSYLKNYTNNYVLYDRSDIPLPEAIRVENRGSDIADKLKFICDNYDKLPDMAIYTKANIFKYISKEEFDLVKDNKTFTPLLTKNHKTYGNNEGPVCFYKDDIYWEVNNYWYLGAHEVKSWEKVYELIDLLGIWNMKYLPFSPGSNYILPKENILKHPKEFYEKLRSYIDWAVYPGECMILERALYTIWS